MLITGVARLSSARVVRRRFNFFPRAQPFFFVLIAMDNKMTNSGVAYNCTLENAGGEHVKSS